MYKNEKEAVYSFVVYLGHLYDTDIRNKSLRVSTATHFINNHKTILSDLFKRIEAPTMSFYEFIMECYNSFCHCLSMAYEL